MLKFCCWLETFVHFQWRLGVAVTLKINHDSKCYRRRPPTENLKTWGTLASSTASVVAVQFILTPKKLAHQDQKNIALWNLPVFFTTTRSLKSEITKNAQSISKHTFLTGRTPVSKMLQSAAPSFHPTWAFPNRPKGPKRFEVGHTKEPTHLAQKEPRSMIFCNVY